MRKGLKGVILSAAISGILLSLGSLSAFASDNYSYMAGQQRSQTRSNAYAQASEMETEQEREAFLAEQGIGDTKWSEEAAASFSYTVGKQRTASYRTDKSSDSEPADTASYGYVTGRQRGSSYNR